MRKALSEPERQKRRKKILRGAKFVFFKFGFRQATMDDVAVRCKLAKGTLYLYFTSKEDLYISLMEDGIALLQKNLKETIIPEAQPIDNIRKLIRAYYKFALEQPEYFEIFRAVNRKDIQERLEEDRLEQFRRAEQDVFQTAFAVMQEAIAKGVLLPDTNIRNLATSLWMTAVGCIVALRENEYSSVLKDLDPEQLLETATESLLAPYLTKN